MDDGRGVDEVIGKTIQQRSDLRQVVLLHPEVCADEIGARMSSEQPLTLRKQCLERRFLAIADPLRVAEHFLVPLVVTVGLAKKCLRVARVNQHGQAKLARRFPDRVEARVVDGKQATIPGPLPHAQRLADLDSLGTEPGGLLHPLDLFGNAGLDATFVAHGSRKVRLDEQDEAIRILLGIRSRLLEFHGKPAEMNDALDSRCVHRGNQSFHRQLRSLRFQVPVHIGGRVARTLDLFTIHLQDRLRLVLDRGERQCRAESPRVVEPLRAQEPLIRIPLDQLTDPQAHDCQQADADEPEQQALASPQKTPRRGIHWWLPYASP